MMKLLLLTYHSLLLLLLLGINNIFLIVLIAEITNMNGQRAIIFTNGIKQLTTIY